tara:strand:+ start:299 stop:529 length:231 start_codon:yes stop_codon:yes gene_type:complete
MIEDIKIEKGIPIAKHSKKAQFEDLILNMNIGDSIVLHSYYDVDYFRQAAHRKNCKIMSRTVKENGQSVHRVWRIK